MVSGLTGCGHKGEMHTAQAGKIAPSVRFADKLTAREAQVLDLIVLGLSNDEAGARLGITARTVEVHRLRAMRKLEAADFCHLMWLALIGEDPPGSWTEAFFREVVVEKAVDNPQI